VTHGKPTDLRIRVLIDRTAGEKGSTTKSMTDNEKDAFFETVGKITPLERIGLPEDIAGAALSLALDLSSYVTGVSIPVGEGCL
jgi:3-oxoacyl-[acyl-carrier protein] reductase